MGTLTINGKRVKVDDSFAKLSPADQQKTVDEIAAQMGGGPTEPPKMDAAAYGNHLVTGEQSQNIERVNPQRSRLPGVVGQFDETSRAAQGGFNDLLTLGFGDELYAGATAPFRALPGLVSGEGYDLGKAYNEGLETTRQTNRDTAALNPAAYTGGQVAGALVNPLGRGKAATTTGGRVLQGLREGATQGAAYGFGSSDGDLQDRAKGALTGGATGAAFGVALPWLAKKGGDVVERFAQNRATSQAIKNAPAADDLATLASSMFKSSKSSGVGVQPHVFGKVARDLASKAHAADIDRELDGAAWTVYERMVEMARNGFNDPSALTLSKLHNLRQKAQDVVMDAAAKGRTKTFAGQLIDGIDNMIESLKPGDLTIPPGRLGGSKNAANDLLEGISTWSKAKKVGLIEEAIYKAGNQASGLENGLRIQFRAILQNPRTRKLFSKAELAEIEKVANGTAVSNIARTVGKLGFDFGPGRNALGGALGLFIGNQLGGPIGAMFTAAAGAGARKVAEKMATSGAQLAARVVATPNVPNVTINNPLVRLPGQAFAPPVIDEMNRRRRAIAAPTG